MDKAILEGIPVHASDIWGINKTIDTNYEKKLKIASRDSQLKCADCGVDVVYRHGQNRKEYFAHKNISENEGDGCTYSKETEEHIEGKQILRRLIKKYYPGVYSETRYRLKDGQWADLYFKFEDGQELIIEFQRNINRIKEWEDKNNYYKSNNVNVMWFTNDEMDLKNSNRAKDLLREYEFVFDKRLLLNDTNNRLYSMDYVSERLMIAAKVEIRHNGKSFMDTIITKTYKLDDIKILPTGEIECDFNTFFEEEKKNFNKLHSNITTLNINNRDEMEFNFTDKDIEFFEFIKTTCNKDLTEEQKKAVLFNDTHHVIQSTAGSGKTSMLCVKIAYLILVKGIAPSEIVVVSFSKNSAEDIEDRFKSWFGNIITDKISFSTIHSFAYKIIKDEERKKGIKYTVIEENKELNKKMILSKLFTKYNKEKINDDQYKGLEGLITYVRNMMIYMSTISSLEHTFPVPNFVKIYKEYSELLINKHYLDYDTQLVMAHHILTKNNDILTKYQNQYSYYLVDESQDNSKIQNEIIKLLSPKGIVCYVGDSDQRIYSWRGADDRFNNFKELYPNSNILFMDQNFRSTSSIVNLANEFIKLDKSRYDKKVYTNNEVGEKVKVLSPNNDKMQLDIIIDTIKEEARPYNDYAILYRNNISAISVVERLDKENIPFYIKEEVSSFFNNFIVKDILNFIRFALNPNDLNSFRQIYYKTMSYISKKAIDKIKPNSKHPIIDNLIYSDDISRGSSIACESLKENFKKLAEETPSSALDIIQFDLNYYNYLDKYSKENNYSMESVDNIISALKGIFEELKSISEVEGKLENLKELMRSSKKNKDINSISLSTMHSSKGLEWDRAYIIDAHMIPSKNSLMKRDEGIEAEYEEEVRTFFVAITRPRKKLTILQPRTKNNQSVVSSEFFKFCSDYVTGISDLSILEDIKLEQLQEGMTIYHKSLGIIHIHKIYPGGFGDIVVDGGELKKISFTTCVNKKLIKKI